jgi:hypothetical protein
VTASRLSETFTAAAHVNSLVASEAAHPSSTPPTAHLRVTAAAKDVTVLLGILTGLLVLATVAVVLVREPAPPSHRADLLSAVPTRIRFEKAVASSLHRLEDAAADAARVGEVHTWLEGVVGDGVQPARQIVTAVPPPSRLAGAVATYVDALDEMSATALAADACFASRADCSGELEAFQQALHAVQRRGGELRLYVFGPAG